MQRVALGLSALLCASAFAAARDGKVDKMLQQLDPDARFEQVCDLEAMKHISRDKTYKPERTIVSALSAPRVTEVTMTGTGGAFRSKGQWYQFSFTCQTSPDHMRVQAFTFQIGAPIPQDQWEAHGLWE